jgi:hypothetical protein
MRRMRRRTSRNGDTERSSKPRPGRHNTTLPRAKKTSPSSSTFFSEGFVPHPTQHRFLSPKISESEPAYGEDVVFSPTTTTPMPRVCRPRLGLHLNHSFASTSPVVRSHRSQSVRRVAGTVMKAPTVRSCSRICLTLSTPPMRYDLTKK